MPQVFVCKWLLTMGIMVQLSSNGAVVGLTPVLPKQATICTPFLSSQQVEGNGKKLFLFKTPGYDEKKYPNNTDCIRILKSPSDKVISLDFRDTFHIEPSSGCEYDYLEIRDGPYGFSPALEKEQTTYCGKTFPLDGRKILSTGQFLWLRFHSDNTIQHQGMKAVYEFVDRSKSSSSKEGCRVPVRLTGGYAKTLTEDNFPQGYLSTKAELRESMDCTFDVTADSTNKVYIHIVVTNYKKNICDNSYIEVYDGFTVDKRRPGLMEGRMCSGKEKGWLSTFNRIVFRVHSKTAISFPRFKVTFTPLTPGPCHGKFKCEKNLCIDAALKCDKRKNCPKAQDEECKMEEAVKVTSSTTEDEEAKSKDKIVPYHYIILGTIGALLCIFILICMFITIRQRRIDLRNRRREEVRRRSSEAQHQSQPQHQPSQSPHSLRRDLHTPSSLEGNRLLEFTGGTGARSVPAETASLGRLNKQNGVVLMGGSGMKQFATGPSSSSGPPPGHNPGLPTTERLPSSSVFYDPRTVHSSRVGKYLSVPNPSGGPADEEEVCLDSPIEPIVGHQCGGGGGPDPPSYATQSQARCKIHGEVYQRDRDGVLVPHHSAHQPIIHRSDSAPSKAFFRAGSATPPPTRSDAETPTASHHHLIRQESPPPHAHPYSTRQHRDAYYYPSASGGASGYHTTPSHHPDVRDPRHQSSPYYSSRHAASPAPAYSLHNLSTGGATALDDEDGPPCICRRHEPSMVMVQSAREPHPGMVRQTSLGTPRSLRRKVYDT